MSSSNARWGEKVLYPSCLLVDNGNANKGRCTVRWENITIPNAITCLLIHVICTYTLKPYWINLFFSFSLLRHITWWNFLPASTTTYTFTYIHTWWAATLYIENHFRLNYTYLTWDKHVTGLGLILYWRCGLFLFLSVTPGVVRVMLSTQHFTHQHIVQHTHTE